MTPHFSKHLTARALSGLLWKFAGSGLNSILHIVVTVVLAHLLVPGDFGAMAAAGTVIGFAELFSQIGVGPALIRQLNLSRETIRTGQTLALGFSVITGGVVALSAPWVASYYRQPALEPVIQLLAFNFPLRSLGVVSNALLQRELMFRVVIFRSTLNTALSSVGLGITLAYMGFGVWALVYSSLANSFLSALFAQMLRPSWHLGFNKKDAGELLFQGGGFTLANFFNYFALQGDYLIIGRWLGTDALGVYTRAYHLMAFAVANFSKEIHSVLFASLSQIQHDNERMRQVYIRGLSLNASLMLPLSTLAFVLAPEAVLLFLGPKWMEAVPPFRVLAAGIFLRTAHKFTGSFNKSNKVIYGHVWRQGIYAASVLIGAFVSIPWGISGVAWAVFAAMSIHFVLVSQLVQSSLGISWPTFAKSHGRGIMASALTGIVSVVVASVLRERSHPAWVVLVSVSITAGGLYGVLIWRFPRLILGESGVWLIDQLQNLFLLRTQKRGTSSVLHADAKSSTN